MSEERSGEDNLYRILWPILLLLLHRRRIKTPPEKLKGEELPILYGYHLKFKEKTDQRNVWECGGREEQVNEG